MVLDAELTSVNVHDVELDGNEDFDGLVEFVENASNGLGHGLTLGVSDVDLLELVDVFTMRSNVFALSFDGGDDFGREIDMTGRIDEVNQERLDVVSAIISEATN